MKIGRYEVIDEMGQGGQGVIFLAHDPYMQRQVVVKVLMFDHAHDEIQREFFQHEAEIIASLEHPFIVPVYDFGWHGAQPYIVMRYMAGSSLADLLRQKALRTRDYAAAMTRICEALDVAHARGIIHRDIKPQNILFDTSRQAFLADFGLAKSLQMTENASKWLVGTPAYMSPEQVQDHPLDGRSDVYALGVMLYEFLTGQLPFGGENSEMLSAHLHEQVPSVLAYAADLPPVWQEIINKAMSKSPDERYASAGEFAQKVQDVASGRWYLRNL